MDRNNIIECGGFYFIHNFDSGNLGHVERVPTEFISPTVNPKTNVAETPDYEFNLWTRPDCAGTEFENGNRTWFYFGIQASEPNMQVRLNLINLNKQGKMYNQGMAPVTRTLPGKPHWERIRDRPVHSTDDNTFTLSFRYKTSENVKATTFFAFTYPYSYAELQIALNTIDLKMLPLPASQTPDDIYYCRECLIYSLEGRRVDLLTITSHHGITSEREDRLKSLFPENQERPFKFQNKKVIFISARVHPGETPSSFVFNGFLNLLLTRNDPIAMHLRKLYVFKMIPFLNPDGVARGHYRTDTRGVNLNRVYLNPSLIYHPTVFASRALIRYYHFGCEKEEDICEDSKSLTSCSMPNISEGAELIETKKKKGLRSPIHKSRGKAQANKSSAIFKHVSVESSRDQTPLNPLSGDATILAEQVYDMKLQEMPSQTSDMSLNQSYNTEASSSLLNEKALKTCLGSNVHLTTSEDLNIHGTNPLKPLRDTLKNSISLLMESASTSEEVPCGCGEARTGWCGACRRAAAALERSAPGVVRRAPAYSAAMLNPESPTCHSIDEYREQQKQQIDDQETKLQDTELADSADNVYFCTNCFNRYIVRDKKTDSDAQVSGVSGDSGDTGDTCVSPGDVLPALPAIQPITVKEEKHKSTSNKVKKKPVITPPPRPPKENESGLYLYIDLHGHASKKGIFMYGNHFEDLESCVECMLLPRIMSLNNLHFHFSSCNFTERNMYLKDRRDGSSREGSGRVAVLKATGLVRSYTLECNYNTGRLVNVLPPAARDAPAPAPPAPAPPAHAPPAHAPPAPAAPAPPPKYTPHIFEEVGRSLGASVLDLTGQHPSSRVPRSEHRSLPAVREWLRAHTRTLRPQLTMSRLRPKTSSPTRMPLYARSKAKVTDERKENAYVGAKTDAERKRSPPLLGQRSGHDIIALNMKFAKKNEPAKPARPRYLSDNEPKPKTLATKRRNILAIRKPNAAKSVSKAKTGEPNQPAKLAKRSYSRCLRRRAGVVASSSSDDAPAATASLDSLAAKRRPFPNPPPAHLKKIRLKTAL